MIKVFYQAHGQVGERRVALTTQQIADAVLANWDMRTINSPSVQIDFDADASDPECTSNCCALMFHDMFDIKVFSYGSYNMVTSYHSKGLYLNAEENNLVYDIAVWVKDAVETAVGDLDALNDGFVYCDLKADGWLEKWLHATYPESEFEVVNNS